MSYAKFGNIIIITSTVYKHAIKANKQNNNYKGFKYK